MIIVSTEAKQNGFGTAPFKRVTNLTDQERACIDAGFNVLFDCGRGHNGSNSGCTWRAAKKLASGDYVPRVPSANLLVSAGFDVGQVMAWKLK